jgi:hypothetical protein
MYMNASNYTTMSRDFYVNGFHYEYLITHSNTDKQVVDKLADIYAQINFDYQVVADGYGRFYMKMRPGRVKLFDDMKMYWLFYGMPFADLSSQLRSFIVEKNNPNLSVDDYVLLFYVSLQNTEMRDATQAFPLDMLYDIFTPVAEANLNKWKAEHLASLHLSSYS